MNLQMTWDFVSRNQFCLSGELERAVRVAGDALDRLLAKVLGVTDHVREVSRGADDVVGDGQLAEGSLLDGGLGFDGASRDVLQITYLSTQITNGVRNYCLPPLAEANTYKIDVKSLSKNNCTICTSFLSIDFKIEVS
jgi:hypothetical protein